MNIKLLKSHLETGCIICIMVFTAFSCQRDEVQIEAENSESIKMHKLLDQSNLSGLISYDYTVDFSNPTKLYSDELRSFYYEFPIRFTSLYSIQTH